MKLPLISEHLVRELAARLTAAGENWPDVAAAEPLIAAFHRANGNSRDTVSLRHEWALNVDDGDGIVVCENLIFRTESDAWIPMGWTAYSQDQHGRPGPDEDAVVRGITGIGNDSPDHHLARAVDTQAIVEILESRLAQARENRNRQVAAASGAGASTAAIAEAIHTSESTIEEIVSTTVAEPTDVVKEALWRERVAYQVRRLASNDFLSSRLSAVLGLTRSEFVAIADEACVEPLPDYRRETLGDFRYVQHCGGRDAATSGARRHSANSDSRHP